MIKSAITALIAARIDGGDNPIATERALWTTLLEAVYPTSPPEEVSVGTGQLITAPINNGSFPYQIKFTKIGKRIFVNGWVRNYTPGTALNTVFFTFNPLVAGIANEYLPEETVDTTTGLPIIFIGEGISLSENRARILILRDNNTGDSKLRIKGAIQAADPHYFNFSYNAKN